MVTLAMVIGLPLSMNNHDVSWIHFLSMTDRTLASGVPFSIIQFNSIQLYIRKLLLKSWHSILPVF